MNLATQIGQKATVTRSHVTSEKIVEANKLIRELGEELNPVQGLTYLGSMAVHIYVAPTIGELVFQSQTGPLGQTQEVVASHALTDLKGAAMEYYNKKRRQLRSGF